MSRSRIRQIGFLLNTSCSVKAQCYRQSTWNPIWVPGTIEPSVGLLIYLGDLHTEDLAHDGKGRVDSAKIEAFEQQSMGREEKVGRIFATIDRAEESTSAASRHSVNQQRYLYDQSQEQRKPSFKLDRSRA